MKTRNSVLSILIIATMLLGVIPYARAEISIQNITPIQGNPGTFVLGGTIAATNVTLSGNAHAGDTVQVNWDGNVLPAESGCGPCTVKSDINTGFYTIWFLVPRSAAGTHTISVKDTTRTSEGFATDPFTVQPIMELDHGSGHVGDSFEAFATGLPAGATLQLTYDGAPLKSVVPNTTGSVTTEFTVPDSIGGGHSIALIDASANQLAGATLNVNPKLLTIGVPQKPIVGSTINGRGTGFKNVEGITLYLAQDSGLTKGKTTLGSFTTDGKGSFPFSFVMPSIPQWSTPPASTFYLVAVSASKANASATVQLYPLLSLNPNHGAVAQQIRATGVGFTASSNLSVTIDGLTRNLHTGLSDTTGSFSFAFNITAGDNLPFGLHTVTATDGSGFTATAKFVFGTAITVTPNQGIAKSPTDTEIPGTTVTVQGFVFTPLSTVTVKLDTTTMTTAKADSDGNITATFVIPESVGGPHSITATDNAAIPRTAQTSLFVLQWINTDSDSGQVGSKVTVTGTGFDASTSVKIYFCGLNAPSDTLSRKDPATVQCSVDVYSLDTNNAPGSSPDHWTVWTTGTANGVLGTVTTDANGGFTKQLTIPESYGGYHPIWAGETIVPRLTSTIGASLNGHVYKVLPTVTLTPLNTLQGRQLTLAASGEMSWEQFQVNEDMTVHQWRFGLDFGPNPAYLDEANFILNGQFDLAWHEGHYIPMSVTQSGNIAYLNAINNVNIGTQFVKVPSLEPGSYPVNAWRMDVLDGTTITDLSATFTVSSPEITTINTHTDTAMASVNAHTDTAVTDIKGKIDGVTTQLSKSIGDARDAVLSLVGLRADSITASINSNSADIKTLVGAKTDAITASINSNTADIKNSLTATTNSLTSLVNSRASQAAVDTLTGTTSTTQSKVSDLQNGVSLTVQTPVGYAIAILAALAAIGSIAAAVITSRRLKVAS